MYVRVYEWMFVLRILKNYEQKNENKEEITFNIIWLKSCTNGNIV